MANASDLIHGTLDQLIPHTIAHEPRQGRAIAKRIQQGSNEVLQITQGALYLALRRPENQGWIKADWSVTTAAAMPNSGGVPRHATSQSNRNHR